jgi:hypothetical protein
MPIDPRDKALIDFVVDEDQRKSSRRGWKIWLPELVLSLICLYAFNHDFVSGWFGTVLGVGGAIGVFLFLAFPSTKPFGHSDFSFRWWWRWRWR